MFKHMVVGACLLAVTAMVVLATVVFRGRSKPWHPLPDMKRMRECWS